MPPDNVVSAADSSARMTPLEIRASVSLAALFGLRLLGMFIILPVFALYAIELPGWDKAWIGVALGIYGLTQAALQIPFGWLSDRIGRKPVLFLGLALFAIGSLVCALSTSVAGLIAGRMLQGSGAISAVVIAMTADLTRESQRTKAMAIIGMTIGLAFALSFVLSPFLSAVIGVPGIFALTGALAIAAMGVVQFAVPNLAVPQKRESVRWSAILADAELLRLYCGIFLLHAILMAMFVVVPFGLAQAGLAGPQHWMLYLVVFTIAAGIMLPFVRSREAQSKRFFVVAIAVLALALLLLAALPRSLAGLALGLTVFFTAFNVLEAKLPALVSVMAPASARGSATGVYSSVQYLGAFVGGSIGGVIAQHSGGVTVLWVCFISALVWLLAAAGMRARISQKN